MPSLTCTCGHRMAYGEIPCRDELLFIADVEFDAYAGPVDAEAIYRAMKSMLLCPGCGHLWVFWDGFQAEAREYAPIAPSASSSE